MLLSLLFSLSFAAVSTADTEEFGSARSTDGRQELEALARLLARVEAIETQSKTSESSSALTAITAMSRRLEKLESQSTTSSSPESPFACLPREMQTILEEQEIEEKDFLDLEGKEIDYLFPMIGHQKKAKRLQEQLKQESTTEKDTPAIVPVKETKVLKEEQPSLVFVPRNRDLFRDVNVGSSNIKNIFDEMVRGWGSDVNVACRGDKTGKWLQTGDQTLCWIASYRLDLLRNLETHLGPLREKIVKIDSELEGMADPEMSKEVITKLLRYLKNPSVHSAFRMRYKNVDDHNEPFRPHSNKPLYLCELGLEYITPVNRAIFYLLFRLIYHVNYKSARPDKDLFPFLEGFTTQIIHPEDKKRFLQVLKMFMTKEENWSDELKTPISLWGSGPGGLFENMCYFAEDWTTPEDQGLTKLLTLTNE